MNSVTGNGVDKQLIQGPQKEMLSEKWHKGWEKDIGQSQSEEHSRRGTSQCTWTEKEKGLIWNERMIMTIAVRIISIDWITVCQTVLNK